MNCEKDEFIEEAQSKNFPFKLKEKTYAELTKTKKFNNAIEKVFKPHKEVMNANYSSKTVMEEQYGFTIDSTIIKEISSDKYTSYTMFIHRSEKYDSFYENLLVEIDNLNNVSAYILKYIKQSEMIIHKEHNSFSQDVKMEVTRIEYNDAQAKMVWGCKDVYTIMCSWTYDHVAHGDCFENDHLFYGSYESCSWSDDGSGGGGGSGGGDGSADTTNGPNPSGGSTGSGSGKTITAPVLPAIEDEECGDGFKLDIKGKCADERTFDDIIDNTDNICIGNIIQELQQKDRFKSLVPDLEGVSHLSQIVLDLFGECKNYDLVIKIAELGTGPNGGLINAETKGIESITLDEDLVEDATKLSIAKTLIHESMHVFINVQINKRDLKSEFYKSLEEYYKKNNTGNLAQHQFMSQFVDALAYSISAYDNHRQDISYYTNLSWGGLEQSDAYKTFNDDKKKEIQTIIKNERDAKSDAKSTKCE